MQAAIGWRQAGIDEAGAQPRLGTAQAERASRTARSERLRMAHGYRVEPARQSPEQKGRRRRGALRSLGKVADYWLLPSRTASASFLAGFAGRVRLIAWRRRALSSAAFSRSMAYVRHLIDIVGDVLGGRPRYCRPCSRWRSGVHAPSVMRPAAAAAVKMVFINFPLQKEGRPDGSRSTPDVA